VKELEDSASDARSAVISEIIGTIIGAAAKAFLGGTGS
jgi:hypothetical protein